MAESSSLVTPTASPAIITMPAVPLIHDLRISKDAEDWLKTLSPGRFQNHDEIQKFWSAPSSQFTLTIMADPELKSATDQMIAANLGSRFFSYEAVLILLLWTFRPWKLARASTWFLRIWTQFWMAIVFWLMAFMGVPWLVWGQNYWIMLRQISKAILRHFLA